MKGGWKERAIVFVYFVYFKYISPIGGLEWWQLKGVPKKTRISENVRHKHNTTFLKEPKCFYKQNMFDSSQGNKFWTIKHALIFKTIVFEEKSCVLCITIISLILVFLGHPVFVVKYLGGSREVATGKHFLAFQCKAQTRDRRCKCSNIPWLYLKVTKWIKYTRIQLCLPWILHEIGSYHFFVKFNVFMEFVRWFLQIFVECMIRYLNFQTLGIRFFDIIPSLASCGLWEKSPETPLE